MKRRSFGLLAGSSVLALSAADRASAQSAPASSLGAGLTPMGSEQAGNADGSIPAWTGGLTAIPAGINVVTQGGFSYVPELFPNEQPVLVVNQTNMAQYADMLTEGIQAMIQKYGLEVRVFPTHRTHALPQWIYDNIAKNQGTAKFVAQDPVGGRFGFEGAYGGLPFPVPDVSNPATAGAQIVWNHNTQWRGSAFTVGAIVATMSNGQFNTPDSSFNNLKYPYYNPNGQPADYDGGLWKLQIAYYAPGNLVGQQLVVWENVRPAQTPTESWELLNGQGRVRRAPEVSFDTPSNEMNGICNYDEIYSFNGSLERYDWKYLGKKEMFVPYNNNGLFAFPESEVVETNFLKPEAVRWEKHRVWIVEATLHPGERNVLAKRILYIDEDTMAACLVDAWDAKGNLFKVNMTYNYCRPDLPGTIFGNNSVNNLQTDSWVLCTGPTNQAKAPQLKFVAYDEMSDSIFDPSNLAASAQY